MCVCIGRTRTYLLCFDTGVVGVGDRATLLLDGSRRFAGDWFLGLSGVVASSLFASGSRLSFRLRLIPTALA